MTTDEVVPISAIEHHLYCPRQCALIHVDGLWIDNSATVRGRVGHERVDSGQHRQERGRRILRAIPLWSETYGLSGRADAIEVHPDSRVVPVEYKIGHGHLEAAATQLCAQALCLEEMLQLAVPTGYLWTTGSRRRTRIDCDAALRTRTLQAVDEIRKWIAANRLPPAENDQRCPACQFHDHCQPELTAHPERVARYTAEVYECES